MAGPQSSFAAPWWNQVKVNDYFGSTWGIKEGYRTRPAQHVDFDTPEGTPITPYAPGKVTEKGFDKMLGNFVRVQDATGKVWTYFHGSEVPVNIGDYVDNNSPVMISGNTGSSSGRHTSVRLDLGDGTLVDPLPYMGLRSKTMPDPNTDKNMKATTKQGTRSENVVTRSLANMQNVTGGGKATSGFNPQPTPSDDVGAGYDPNMVRGLGAGDLATRALINGGLPLAMMNLPFFRQIAAQLGAYSTLNDIAGLGLGQTPFDFLSSGNVGAAFDPNSIMQLFAKIAGLNNVGMGATGQDVANMALQGQGGEGRDTTNPTRVGGAIGDYFAGQGMATPDQGAAVQGAFGGIPLEVGLSSLFNDPEMLQMLTGAMSFGRPGLGQLLDAYMPILQRAFAAYTPEYGYAGKNPLGLLAGALGGRGQ